jgi:riboflavin transporter FmnP
MLGMNTKTLALIVVFAALTIALNLEGPKISAPFAPGVLWYQIWEIPIVVVFLLIGPKAGAGIAVLNTLILLAVFPGALPTGPFYNLIAVASMLLGIYVAYIIYTRGCPAEEIGNFLRQHAKGLTISITALGIIFRVAITTVSNYFLLQQIPPIGFGSSPHAAIVFLPSSILFNATLALYTVPIAVLSVITIKSRFRI